MVHKTSSRSLPSPRTYADLPSWQHEHRRRLPCALRERQVALKLRGRALVPARHNCSSNWSERREEAAPKFEYRRGGLGQSPRSNLLDDFCNKIGTGLKVMHVDVDGGFLGDNGRVLLVASLSQCDPELTSLSDVRTEMFSSSSVTRLQTTGPNPLLTDMPSAKFAHVVTFMRHPRRRQHLHKHAPASGTKAWQLHKPK